MAPAKKGALVPRPPKKVEYEIRFATSNAEKGWIDLVATIRNQMTETWDFLTRTPHLRTPTNYPLKGDFEEIVRGGKTYIRWQHKPTEKGTARVWFFVEGRTVWLEQVHTSHPNQTK